MRRVAIFGGAGFLGSRIAREFVARGDEVVVVDGLLPKTGGSPAHLAAVRHAVDFRAVPVEEVADLGDVLQGCAVAIDCMAWTRHVSALDAPLYDLKLNLESHIRLLLAARAVPALRLIYLGSRGEYGRADGRITEETPLVPQDVQSVHKAAADHHFRIYAALWHLNVLSLRLPNCFGIGQPVDGEDIGLVGQWIRAALTDAPITLYGTGRRRWLLYADDLAHVIARLSDVPFTGFAAYNVAGQDADLGDLAHLIVRLAGGGTVVVEPMPSDVQATDVGNAWFDEARLRALLGVVPPTDLRTALGATVDYFKERLQ